MGNELLGERIHFILDVRNYYYFTREWIPVCMIIMAVERELSTTDIPWSF
jgi:hypothetical protein